MKRIKQIVCVLLAALMVAVTGCSAKFSGAASAAKTGKAITVTDDNGNTVTVPAKINRIVVCDILPLPSVLAVFFDSAKKIVGMSGESMSAAKNSLLSELYPEILKADTSFINGSSVNMEELTGLRPDVVFYSASDKQLGVQLKNAGLSGVAISPSKEGYDSIKTLDSWIALLSQIFPGNDKSKTVKSYSDKVYNTVQSRVKDIPESARARVFFLFQYSPNTILSSGKNFFGEWWAEAIGAKNVAEGLTTDNAVSVNMEQIDQWNPDIVFITNFTTYGPEDLYQNKVGSFNWSSVSAVKNKKVYKMPLGMYRSYTPGVDTPITLLWLAKTAYPDKFSDIDLVKEVKNYYKTVFGVQLTDKQADSIFNPAAAAGSGF